jgi:hypothetical protein
MKAFFSILAVSLFLFGGAIQAVADETTSQTETPTGARQDYEAQMKQEIEEQEARNSNRPLTEDAKAAWQGVKDGWNDVKTTTDEGWTDAKSKLDDSWGAFKSKWKEVTSE